jgi:hypothetical protein
MGYQFVLQAWMKAHHLIAFNHRIRRLLCSCDVWQYKYLHVDYSVIFVCHTVLPFSKWNYLARKIWNSISWVGYVPDSILSFSIMSPTQTHSVSWLVESRSDTHDNLKRKLKIPKVNCSRHPPHAATESRWPDKLRFYFWDSRTTLLSHTMTPTINITPHSRAWKIYM